jgi:hypothetical protein
MFEIAVAVAEETRPREGRVFSVCVVGLVNDLSVGNRLLVLNPRFERSTCPEERR